MTSTTVKLDLAHYSMQFSDGPKAHLHDARVVFDRNYDWITGTEAGEDPLRKVLRVQAHSAGYTFFEFKSNWIAVNKEIIKPGSYRRDAITVTDNDKTVGRGHDPSVAIVQFEHERGLDIAVLASHYSLLGIPGGDKKHTVNLRWNRDLAKTITNQAKVHGKGAALVFYGGDQNILDRTKDTFFGGPMTSAWDELKKYEDTGHGNIDVIASYDKDGRVEAKYVRSLQDDELFMNTDHFPVEAGYLVHPVAA